MVLPFRETLDCIHGILKHRNSLGPKLSKRLSQSCRGSLNGSCSISSYGISADSNEQLEGTPLSNLYFTHEIIIQSNTGLPSEEAIAKKSLNSAYILISQTRELYEIRKFNDFLKNFAR